MGGFRYETSDLPLNVWWIGARIDEEGFPVFKRMYENFSGSREISYCVMSSISCWKSPRNRRTAFPMRQRLGALARNLSRELLLAAARTEGGLLGGNEARVREIHERFTYRMESLSHYMQGLLIRFTRWFNRKHKRSGTLWEERFKSVIVESGTAARTLAAYIDLNPVRAGMVEDPAEYRWSGYGEAVGGGNKGNGKKAREGLVRAYLCHNGTGFDSGKWRDVSRGYRRLLGMALERKSGRSTAGDSTNATEGKNQNEAETLESGETGHVLKELSVAKILSHRVRYFTDGAVIGSREFVNHAFAASRERFSSKRKDGARKIRDLPPEAKGHLWSMRDLRVEVSS